MVVILGAASFDGRPVDVSHYRNFIDNLSCPHEFESRAVGDSSCCVFARPRHRLDKTSCVLEAYGSYIVAGSVRLDNRVELVGALAVPDARILSDGALVARAFAKWGPDCAEKIYGEYGFVVWSRADRRLFMISDHIRSIRLFALRETACILFSNHLETLTRAAAASPRISSRAVAHFLARPPIPLRHSFFDGIISAPAGGYIELSSKGEREALWWQPLENPGEVSLASNEYEDAFFYQVNTAVKNSIRDDAIYGSHLTGGIDSGTVSLLASNALRERGQKLAALFSWTPPISAENPHMGSADERNFLQAFAREHNSRLVLGNASAQDLWDILQRPFELEGTASVVDEIATIRRASQEGVEVILSGWGGDEVFSAHGFGYLAWLLGKCRLRDAATTARRYTQSRRLRTLLAHVWHYGVVPHFPDRLYEIFSPQESPYPNKCFRSSDLDAHSTDDSYLKMCTRFVGHPYQYSKHLLDTAYPADRIETWRNWSHQYAIRHRYPLLDRALLEFLFRIPPDEVFRRGSRGLTAQVFVPRLPAGMGKRDRANERFRGRRRLECWAALAAEVANGAFDAPSEFVDVERLRSAITQVPSTVNAASSLRFVELSGAVRGYLLSQRRNAA